jgi:antitoxin (DNA-binding transcriptional repressor) of toxin-antitoxin stability system
MKKLTIEEFQKNFDEVIERVENGESFLVGSCESSVMLVPSSECGESEDYYRIYTDHDEAP